MFPLCPWRLLNQKKERVQVVKLFEDFLNFRNQKYNFLNNCVNVLYKILQNVKLYKLKCKIYIVDDLKQNNYYEVVQI